MEVIAIGDMHFPFSADKTIKNVIKYIGSRKPDVIIQLGDLYDQYYHGRFDKDLNIMTPEVEERRARIQALSFWNEINRVARKAKKYQIIGNHDIRILKTTKKNNPSALHHIKKVFKDLYSFQRVTTLTSDRDYLEFDDVIYCHGWASSHINHFRKSVVRAHDHKAWMKVTSANRSVEGKGLKFTRDYKLNRSQDLIFEISAGMFGDESKVPFGYTSSRRTNWKPAISIVTKEYAELKLF